MSPMPALSGTHKTNITAVETAVTFAINSLTSNSDSWQVDARAVLDRIRRDLELLRVLRGQ